MREFCGCHGTEHGLVPDADGCAKQCQNCGNIYCEKQGPGDCLFCGASDGQLQPEASVAAGGGRLQMDAFKEQIRVKDEHFGRNRLLAAVRRFTATVDPTAPQGDAEQAAGLQQLIYDNLAEQADPDDAVEDDQVGEYDADVREHLG